MFCCLQLARKIEGSSMKGAEVWGVECDNDPGVNARSDGGGGVWWGLVCAVRGVFSQGAFCQMLKEGQPIRYGQGWCLHFQLPRCRLIICCIGAADVALSTDLCSRTLWKQLESIDSCVDRMFHLQSEICHLNEMSPALSKWWIWPYFTLLIHRTRC